MDSYAYVRDGKKTFSDSPPPVGTPYDKLKDGKVVERNVVQNGTVGRLVTEEGGSAAPAADAAAAKSQAKQAAIAKAKSASGELKKAHALALERRNAAAQHAKQAVSTLLDGLKKLNGALKNADLGQDIVDAIPTLAGLVVAGPETVVGKVALVVGQEVLAKVNEAARPPEAEKSEAEEQSESAHDFAENVKLGGELLQHESHLFERFGKYLDAKGVIDNIAEGPRTIGLEGGGSDAIGAIKDKLDAFKPAYAEGLALEASGVDLGGVRDQAGRALEAQREFEAAEKEERKAASAATKAEVAAWVLPLK